MLKIKGDSYGSTNLTLSPSGIKLFNLNCQHPSLSLESPKTLSIIWTLISSKNPWWLSSVKNLKNYAYVTDIPLENFLLDDL